MAFYQSYLLDAEMKNKPVLFGQWKYRKLKLVFFFYWKVPLLGFVPKVEMPKFSKISCSIWRISRSKTPTELKSRHAETEQNGVPSSSSPVLGTSGHFYIRAGVSISWMDDGYTRYFEISGDTRWIHAVLWNQRRYAMEHAILWNQWRYAKERCGGTKQRVEKSGY